MSFYQCPQCQNRWQYPLFKCPDCFLELKKIDGEKVKVIGVSEVNIPTILHPKTPYFALVLEDEKGNRWVQKSEKGYLIGDEFSLESIQGKAAVAIWRIKYDVPEAIEKVIALVGGIKVKQNTKILILPTLLTPKHPHLAENTSPEFLEDLIKYLLQKGANASCIKVAVQSFNNFPIGVSAQKSQLLRVCQKNKISPLDLSKEGFIKKEVSGFSLEISQQVLDNDLIINLPILKLDTKLKIKGAAHNALKFLKKESYLSLQDFHKLQDLLIKVPNILPELLTLAESNVVQKKNKQTVFLGLALASFNPLNLDRVFAEIVMQENLPKYLKDIKIENIPIIGRQIEELKYKVN